MILDLGNEEYNQLIELLQTLDADNSGKIDYSEFINLCIEKKKLLSKENLKITFQSLDLDNNGILTLDELKQAFEAGGNKKTKKFWREFISQADQNNDNQLTFDEFSSIMEKLMTPNE